MDPAALQRRLLHQGGTPGHWGNLGLWHDAPAGQPPLDYAAACRALALAVGRAAGLQPGHRVLSLACGAGDELLMWAGEGAVAQVLGVDIDPGATALARQRTAHLPQVQVLCHPATALAGLAAADGPFDAIVCVDAAYHLAPRRAWLAAMRQRLRPGGRLAYGDLTLAGRASPLLRAAARLCGVPADDLLPLPAQVQRLQALGFADVQAQALDEAVLGGFHHFVRQQAAAHRLRAWQAGWRAVATTAALIPPCRAAGLGYALLSAARPSSSAATAAAEPTALSNSGMPACA